MSQQTYDAEFMRRTAENYERYFVPKVGLVREVQVSTLGGKLTSRREMKMVGGESAYTLVADPSMKGRLGRVQVAYPADTNCSGARVAIFKGEPKEKDKPMSAEYGEHSFELMPGTYAVAINNKRVPIEVKSGHRTVPRVGVLRVHAGSGRRSRPSAAATASSTRSSTPASRAPAAFATRSRESWALRPRAARRVRCSRPGSTRRSAP